MSRSLQPSCGTPSFPALHYIPEFAQIHVHWVSDAIQPSHPLQPLPPAFNLSQHQGLFLRVDSASGGQIIGISASASILPMNIQGWFPLGWTGQISLLSKGLLRVFSSTTVQNFSGWTLTNSYPTELNPCHPYISKIAFHQKSQIGGLWVAEGSYSFGLTSTYWVRDVKK